MTPEAISAVNALGAFFGRPINPGSERPTFEAYVDQLDDEADGAKQFLGDPIGLLDIALAGLADRKERTATDIRDRYGKNIEAVRTALECLVFLGLVQAREVPTSRRYRLTIPPRKTTPAASAKARQAAPAVPRFPAGSLRHLAQSFPQTVLSLSLELLDPEM